MAGQVEHTYVYPVKGLSPQRLTSIPLEPGKGVPHDRAFALARPDGRYVADDPTPLRKTEFFMLMRDERLASVRSRLDTDTGTLTVSHDNSDDGPRLDADLRTSQGRAALTAFFADLLGVEPVLAHAEGRRFTDVSVVSDRMMNAVSLINLASVRELEKHVGAPVDPLRFRANIYVDGLPPFSELGLVGKDILLGETRLRAVLNTKRCAATTVNPATAERDLNIPKALMAAYGHVEMGCYAEVIDGGTVRPGDSVRFAGV